MSTIFTLGGKSCVAATLDLYRSFLEQGLPTHLWWGKANGFRNTLGHDPGTGSLLMLRDDLDTLGAVGNVGAGDLSKEFDLVIDDGTTDGKKTLKKINVTRTECLTPGLRDDKNGLHVVSIADKRARLKKIANAAYNLRNCDGGGYQSETTNGGTAWTWQQMVNDLADKMQSGLTLTLPYTPDGKPEQFDFYTVPALRAISIVADRLGCGLYYNSIADTFAIVEIGAADTTHVTAINALDDGRTFDAEQTGLRAPVPRRVRVLFPILPPPTDGTTPWESLDEDCPQYEPPADTTKPLRDKCWPDSVQLLNGDMCDPALSGQSETARAMEKRDKFYQAWIDSAIYPLLRVYSGLQWRDGILPGKRVKAISWYDRGDGCKTEVYRGLGILPAGWSLDLSLPDCKPTPACVKCCCCCVPCKGPLWLTVPPFVIDHGHCGMCTGIPGLCGPVTFPKFMLQPNFTPGSTSYPRCWSCSTASPWIVAISKMGDVSVGTINLSISVCCNAKNQCPILTISGTYTINATGATYFNVNAGTYPMCIGPVPADAVFGCQVRDDDDEGGPIIWAATWTAATINDCDEGNWGCACHSSFVADFDLRCGVKTCEATGIPDSFPVLMTDTSIVLGSCATVGSGCYEIGGSGMGGGGKTATMTKIVGPVVIDGNPGIDSVMCDQMWKGTITTTSGCLIQIYLLLATDGSFALLVQNDPANNPGCTTIVNNILSTDFGAAPVATVVCNPLCLAFTFSGAASIKFGSGC